MKFFDLNSFYIITNIKEHEKNKKKLISLINKMEQSSIEDENSHISKTDWNLSREKSRDYLILFYEIIKPYMDTMKDKLKCNNWNIKNTWYQIYKKNDNHDWHVHPDNNYTNVYYLNLPKSNVKTQLYDVKSNKIIDEIDIKEGQLFTFPANILHRSPKNKFNETKTIISFNSNFQV